MKLSTTYSPGEYEKDIYALWEKAGAFIPAKDATDTYSIVMPPPNANANMHLGYAITTFLEDIPSRYHRMKGDATLLLPGADHAGFETWVVYEKQLAKEGKSRFDFSREDLYKQVWDFVALNRQNFETQLRMFGASCDWNHFTFTLDDKIIKRAYQTFKSMWDEGLIYRGERLVNYCTFHGTSFADIEVEHRDEQGSLWYIRYPLTDGSGEVIVATTRPETMLGDTGVAVHPDDERYAGYAGKTVTLPLTGREVPIVADSFVDISYGTGAVKLTPAHDQNDYDAAERHALPKIQIINREGAISSEAPAEYRGMTVLEARRKVVADLEAAGALVKTEEINHGVGHCYKCGTVIEPLLAEQWFINMQPLAKSAIEALEADQITFYPASKKDQLINYLKGLRDWNISRQIAWGIPIPAFQNVDNPDDWIYDERVDQEIIEVDGKTYHRDTDVFDTWFSSSSWPYATLEVGSEDFDRFYPLNLMETGGEILYPWVSRMIMLGLYVTGKIPFKEVYIHGYVMAEDGSKMSKSVGNVVDPLPVIEEYGADALRIGLITNRAPAVNRGYDTAKVIGGRNFCNKLWNIARYIEDKVGEDKAPGKPVPKTIADYWLMYKIQQSIPVVTSHLEEYRFSEAFDVVHELIWDDLADWYIEASKSDSNSSVMAYALKTVLALAHPFAPFVTETIWQTLDWHHDSLLITSAWPKPLKAGDKDKATQFEQIQSLVTEIRAITKSLKARDVVLEHDGDTVITDNSAILQRLSGLKGIVEANTNGLNLTSGLKARLQIDEATLANYRDELHAKEAELAVKITQLQGRLNNESYVSNAPAAVVQQTKDQMAEAEAQSESIAADLTRFA